MQERFGCGIVRVRRGKTLASEQAPGAQPLSPFNIVFAPIKFTALLAAKFVRRDWPPSGAMLTSIPRSQVAKQSLQIS